MFDDCEYFYTCTQFVEEKNDGLHHVKYDRFHDQNLEWNFHRLKIFHVIHVCILLRLFYFPLFYFLYCFLFLFIFLFYYYSQLYFVERNGSCSVPFRKV